MKLSGVVPMVEFNPFSPGYGTMKMAKLRSRKEDVPQIWGRRGLASAFPQGTPSGAWRCQLSCYSLAACWAEATLQRPGGFQRVKAWLPRQCLALPMSPMSLRTRRTFSQEYLHSLFYLYLWLPSIPFVKPPSFTCNQETSVVFAMSFYTEN